MQQVNDHMDDLFKDAADHYPLNTETSDWENFRNRIIKKNGNPVVAAKTHILIAIKKLSAAAILLFIPLSMALLKVSLHQNWASTAIAPAEHGAADKDVALLSKPDNIISKQKGTIHLGSTTDRNIDAFIHKARVFENPGNYFVAVEPYLQKQNILAVLHQENAFEKMNTLGPSFQPAEQSKKMDVKETVMDSKTATAQRSSRFYIGAVVAPEYTSVKHQQFTKPGINFGVVTGYQFSRKLSVELGILLAKKYYYTDGKYVQKNDLARDGSDILSVDAYNSITELPFAIKYNFSEKKSSNFFATAGLVSYVMHKELYNYSYDADGQLKEGVKYINKSSNYYFSNVQLSVGFDHAVSKNTTIRIEPYYRIPISGIGISDLPVTSVGLNLAITTKVK